MGRYIFAYNTWWFATILIASEFVKSKVLDSFYVLFRRHTLCLYLTIEVQHLTVLQTKHSMLYSNTFIYYRFTSEKAGSNSVCRGSTSEVRCQISLQWCSMWLLLWVIIILHGRWVVNCCHSLLKAWGYSGLVLPTHMQTLCTRFILCPPKSRKVWSIL